MLIGRTFYSFLTKFASNTFIVERNNFITLEPEMALYLTCVKMRPIKNQFCEGLSLDLNNIYLLHEASIEDKN